MVVTNIRLLVFVKEAEEDGLGFCRFLQGHCSWFCPANFAFAIPVPRNVV